MRLRSFICEAVYESDRIDSDDLLLSGYGYFLGVKSASMLNFATVIKRLENGYFSA